MAATYGYDVPIKPARRCIARAYGGEPLAYWAVGYWPRNPGPRVRHRSIFIAREPLKDFSDPSGVGFPDESVFEWDEPAYQRIRTHWERHGDDSVPRAMWAALTRFSVNRGS